jgi:carboxyl-terminal processing protease
MIWGRKMMKKFIFIQIILKIIILHSPYLIAQDNLEPNVETKTQVDASALSIKKNRFELLESFNKILFLIENQYYKEVDTEKLIEGAIKGMMETLDPHSSYLDKDVFSKMQSETSGEFGGLGIEVTQKDGTIIVISPIDDTPAYRAGIKPGDKIVEIDHESTLGMGLDDAIKKMKGKSGEKIKIGIIRSSSEGIKYFDLKREIIQVKPVKFNLLAKEYGYIRLIQFQKRSADSIRQALKKLKSQVVDHKNLKGIILDLRSNPGGLLDEAVEVSSIFLKEGIIVSTEGRDPTKREVHFVTKSGDKEIDMPMVVLINGASASASEIVAGALQDQKRALVLGTKSFGKGSVQSVARTEDGSGVKLTIAQYMTPHNRKIQALGIIPDIEVDEYEYDFIKENEKKRKYIRESDLKNHLSAAVESEEEMKLRIAREKDEKDEKIKEIENKKLKKELKKKNKNLDEDDEDDEKIISQYEPSKDFQVIQALNHLKGLQVYKKLIDIQKN